MGIRQILFAIALAVPLIGSIAMLERSLPPPGSHLRPEVPDWFVVPFLWAIVLKANADRFFATLADDRPSGLRTSASRLMFGFVVVYAAVWIAEMLWFAARYFEGRGDLGGLLWWRRGSRSRTGWNSWLPGGVGPFYLYTLAFALWAAIRGYDRVKHHEELIR